ncbi:MAG: hypothetical protein EOO61_17825, partial [Hymenobacter sp.]
MKMNLLHLSDLHYRLNWHEDQGVVLKAFFADLAKQAGKIDVDSLYLVFSGDIVQAGGSKELYDSFYDTFDRELNKVGIP